MKGAIVVLAIGMALGGMSILAETLGGPGLGIAPLMLTLAGWAILTAALGQKQTEQLCELAIAAALVLAALWKSEE